MRHDRKFAILVALVTSFSWVYRAHADEVYPQSALSAVYSEQQLEEDRARDLERQNVEKRDQYEKMKRETERQIEAHRFEIENLKMRSEKAQQELEETNVNLNHVQDNIATYEEDHKKFDEATRGTMELLAKSKSDLDNRQKELDAQIASLADAKKKAERFIYEKSMEVAHMKDEVSKANSKVAEAEAARANYEADEMKVRTDWMKTKLDVAEHLKQRDDAVAQMNDSRKRYEAAQKELQAARTDLARAEKEHAAVSAKTHGEIAKYEKDLQNATHARLMAEAERIRVESETSKVQEYASRLKENRDEAMSKSDEAQGLVLKSTVALASARTELGQGISESDTRVYRQQQEEAQARGIASAEEAHNIYNGRSWTTKEDCTVYSEPVLDSNKEHGTISRDTTVMGKPSGLNWLEVRGSSGESVYIQKKCARPGKKG